ncbi:acyl-CoA carboxylase subunit epsilon [Kineococcus sp. T13]|uniref:acyl-CoA carboxylase epsilon subunit n=1 Tax=Kineococcus vitellinus TaxID=2696565 RepID=UPI001411D966|nr:acyl-CoA carboxylase subunit epsilon [Kineococcus vitellinus]
MSGWEVGGHPTDAELAAVVAALGVLRAGAARPGPRPPAGPVWRDGWGEPSALLRSPLPLPPADPEEDPR